MASAGGAGDLRLCNKEGLQPTVFYRWQKELFENGAAAFQGKEHTWGTLTGGLGSRSKPYWRFLPMNKY